MRPTNPEVLVTRRLQLEPLREDHADDMVGVLAPSELYEFTGGAGPNLQQLRQQYRSQVAGPAGSDEIWLNWVLRETGSEQAAGYVQATVISQTADVAWLVGRDFQGRGFGAEAASAMWAWLGSNGVTSFTAHIHPNHVASQRVASALGMAQTGEVDEDGEEIWASP